MQLTFIYGPAACGKLTVAQEVAKQTGHRLFHNHLTVDLALSLFEFGATGFVRLRETVWLAAFDEAARSGTSFVFTFQPEATVAPEFPERAATTVREAGGHVAFVELTCPEPEIERRVAAQSRKEFRKLRSLPDYIRLRDSGAFEFPAMPAPDLRLDTHSLTPPEAADAIVSLLSSAS